MRRQPTPDRRSRRRCDRARAYEAGDGRRRACACRSPGSNSVSARIARGRTRRGCGYRLLAAAPRARRRARRPCAAAARAHAQPCVAACAGAHGACARAPARRAHRGVEQPDPACARAAKRAGADIIYVPALNYKRGEAVMAGQRSATAEQAGYPKQAVVALPTVEHDQVPGTREAAIDFDPWRYVKPGKPVLVENLAGLVRARRAGIHEVEVGPHIPITNPLSLAAAAELGARRVWLSPELTLGADRRHRRRCRLS